MTKDDPKSVTYLPVEEEFFKFFCFSLFSQQMAEKIGNEMQTQGIKMKRPAVPTKVCRFPSHNCEKKVYLLKLTLYDTTVLDKKCSEVCTFLLTGDPPCEFGATLIPPPTPPWSKMFSQEQKCSSCTSTLFFLGGKGKYVE